MNNSTKLLALFFQLFLPITVLANHGPGTTGGGALTQSGETISEGQFMFSLNETYTNYENVSRAEAEERAIQSGEFDALSDAYLTSASLGYGVTDDFQIDASIGWYSGRNFIDAHLEGAEESESTELSKAYRDDSGLEEGRASSAVGDPNGLTDLMLRAKYRVLKGNAGHLSLIGGGIFPVGRDSAKLSDGDRLEPSSQPGSGRYSASGGVAYSKYLTPQITLDASSIYTYRFERVGFQIGDRADTGIALAYRFNQSVSEIPQVSIFFEVTHQYIGKDQESGSSNLNSGGNTIFLSPGGRVGITKDTGIIIAPIIPVVQNLNGDQLETDFRLVSQLFCRF